MIATREVGAIEERAQLFADRPKDPSLALGYFKPQPPEVKGMGFFDDIGSAIGGAINTVGRVVGAAGSIIDKVPGAENLIPFGSVISSAGAFASGGVGGLVQNMVGRAQTIAPVAAGALGLPPQIGTLAGNILGRVTGGFTGGGGGGSGGAGATRTIFDLAPTGFTGGGTRPNPVLNAPPLNTSIALREPIMLPGRTTFSLGGPYGINFSGGGGGAAFTPPAGYSAGNVGTAAAFRSMLLQQASAAAGFKVTWKKLLYLLLRFGLEVVKKLTQLDDSAILWLYTTRPHRGRRGPHLRTIAKRARQVQGYRHSIARIARIIGAGRSVRPAAAGPTRHRRRKAR